MHVADRLQDSIDRTASVACVGLDPRPGLIPPALARAALDRHGDTREAVADAFLAFNRGLIDAIAGRCAAVKPQAACYEAYGPAGMRALEATVAHARGRGVPVIMDAKRGDIGSTAEHYQQAWLGAAPGLGGAQLPGAGADWLTINGWLGEDGVRPFLGAPPSAAGVFVLVKTSNPSSGDLQDVRLDGGSVADAMARLVSSWGGGHLGRAGLSAVGAVVGATYPDQARRLRALMPDTVFLVPGYGAQGGSARDALAGARADGRGIIVSSSRAIIGAWQKAGGEDWAAAARAALDEMNRDLAGAR
ncbi:MAG TPA: orotidine-5'-phosphate decarboxylase [Planctomycetota bacterium]|nr:orotidine-5'-phosphate decarboxylase [Planctomycetota bacterium]